MEKKKSIPHINQYQPSEWVLGKQLGYGFERAIYQIINKQLANNFADGVRIDHSQEGPDCGKDIVITSPVPICFLNHNFGLDGKHEISICIQCKSSDKDRIRYDKIAGSFARAWQDSQNKINYYVLVSNSSVPPSALSYLQADAKKYDINFIVIDQHLLLKSIEGEAIFGIPPKSLTGNIYYEYQTCTTIVNNKNAHDIFFTYRNLSNQGQLVTQRLLTDNNWSITESNEITIEKKFFIEAYRIHLEKITVVRDYADGINDLMFSIEHKGCAEKQINITGKGLAPVMEVPFFGENHQKCVDSLTERIGATDKFDLCAIWGEAGIGKTRIFIEVRKRLNNQKYDIFSVEVRNNGKYLTDIKRFLLKREYLHHTDKSETLVDMLQACNNEYMRAIILIDDCHNIADDTLNELKLLIGTSVPVTIVLCGRTDYSIGSTDYYAFVQYSKKNNNIKVWQLESFSDRDAKNFIRELIKRIPDSALDRIWKASNNNPLFIIHFIEYLLELNLVELYNRSSVGITNISFFNSRFYIPKSMEDIYDKRIKHLKNSGTDAENLLRYLFILSIMQDKQVKSRALSLLSEDKLNGLVQKRFLSISENGEIVFSHESFALYIRTTLEKDAKLRKKLAYEFFSDLNYLLEDVDKPLKGVLALWASKKVLAIECFADIISRVEKTTNHSAFNTDISSHKYLDYILNLFSADSSQKELMAKVIKTKLYTSLHHFSPTTAIADCDKVLDFLCNNKVLKNDNRLYNSVKQQKAHAMINAGYLYDGELLMKELISDWLKCCDVLDDDTLFDLYDRFCGLYVKFNCKNLALNFNEISKTKIALSDKRLMALVHLSHAKIFFLNDFEVASQSLMKVQELLKDGESRRIMCSSKVSHLVIKLLHKKCDNYHGMIKEAKVLLKEAEEGKYSHSIARINLVLSVLSFLAEEKNGDLWLTKKHIETGIDYSIKIGFVHELWEFYNLLAIVQLRLGVEVEQIRQTFSTVFAILKSHDYLNLGMCDLCCDNILVLSNIGFFYQSKNTEKEFYEHMSKVISFYGVKRFEENSIAMKNFLKKEYVKAKDKKLLFATTDKSDLLRDSVTGYFIALS